MSRNKKSARWALLALAPLVLMACFTAEAARRELDHEVFSYHRDLRWQRCGQAASKLTPDLREAFTTRCGDLEGRMNIEGIEILDVKFDEDDEKDGKEKEDEEGDGATLRVRFTFVKSPSVTLEKSVVTERWVREEGHWRLVEGVWPEAEESAP